MNRNKTDAFNSLAAEYVRLSFIREQCRYKARSLRCEFYVEFEADTGFGVAVCRERTEDRCDWCAKCLLRRTLVEKAGETQKEMARMRRRLYRLHDKAL